MSRCTAEKVKVARNSAVSCKAYGSQILVSGFSPAPGSTGRQFVAMTVVTIVAAKCQRVRRLAERGQCSNNASADKLVMGTRPTDMNRAAAHSDEW